MISNKKYILLALAFPIALLLCLSFYKSYKVANGNEIILPITGYDPRDLLSGHYLVYNVDYGISDLCAGALEKQEGYACLDLKMFLLYKEERCQRFIRGNCISGRFEAGIEKFFIPENEAASLDKKIRGKEGSLVLSVDFSGRAQIKDLLINGKPWREAP